MVGRITETILSIYARFLFVQGVWCTKSLLCMSLSEAAWFSSHPGVNPVVFLSNLAHPWLPLLEVSCLSCHSAGPHARKQNARAPTGELPALICLAKWILTGSTAFDLPGIQLSVWAGISIPSHSSALKGFGFLRLSRHSSGCALQTRARAFLISPSRLPPKIIGTRVSHLGPLLGRTN